MVDTPNKGYPLQNTGDNIGLWGDFWNDQMTSILDINLGGRVSRNVSGTGNVFVTSDDAKRIFHRLIGTLLGNIYYIFPAGQGGDFVIENATTGNFTLTVQPDGGSGFVVPPSAVIHVFIDPDLGAAVSVGEAAVVPGGGLEFSGVFLIRSALTGPVTAPAGSGVTTIGDGQIALSNLATQPAATVEANLTAGVTSATAATISAWLDAVATDVQGTILARGASAWALLAAGAADNIIAVSSGLPVWTTVPSVFNAVMGATVGGFLYRGASAWQTLAPGAVDTVLRTNGVGADPSWVVSSVVGAATNAEMIAALAANVFGSPGSGKFTPHACKAWAGVTVTSGVPTLGQAFGIGSVTDTGVGVLTVNFLPNFSSNLISIIPTVGSTGPIVCLSNDPSVSSAILTAANRGNGNNNDPDSWSVECYANSTTDA